MPRSDSDRLIDLETRIAFQDRTLSQLDEQLRWAVEQLQALELLAARLKNQDASPGPPAPIDGVGYGGEDAPASPPAAEQKGHPSE